MQGLSNRSYASQSSQTHARPRNAMQIKAMLISAMWITKQCNCTGNGNQPGGIQWIRQKTERVRGVPELRDPRDEPPWEEPKRTPMGAQDRAKGHPRTSNEFSEKGSGGPKRGPERAPSRLQNEAQKGPKRRPKKARR